MRERHVPYAAVSEEGRDALFRQVEKLIRQDDVGRRVGLLHRAAGRGREKPRAAELPETPNVRAIVDLGRQEGMVPPVSGEKGDGDRREISENVRIGGCAEGGPQPPILEDL